jgi:hypothetical protein
MVGAVARLVEETMTMTMPLTYATRSLRPRGLSPALAAKFDRMKAVSTKRQRIERIRLALQAIIDQLEREREARRIASVGGGTPSHLLAEVLGAVVDFEVLVERDLR